jgi:hypothetical protein
MHRRSCRWCTDINKCYSKKIFTELSAALPPMSFLRQSNLFNLNWLHQNDSDASVELQQHNIFFAWGIKSIFAICCHIIIIWKLICEYGCFRWLLEIHICSLWTPHGVPWLLTAWLGKHIVDVMCHHV